MRYSSNGIYDSPSVNGAIDEYKISIFVSEHSELDERSQRRLTAIEINLHSKMSVSGAVASGGMVPIVEGLDINQEYRPPVKGWEDSYIVRTNDLGYMQGYLNDTRLSKVIELMQIDKAWIILLFFGGKGLLRFDTPIAMDDPKAMDDLLKKLIEAARILELDEGEERSIVSKQSKLDNKQKVLDVDDDLLDDDIGLELESETPDDDEAEQ